MAERDREATGATALLLLEHINLNVSDAELAHRFFIDGLGCCPDPDRAAKRKSLHVNVGAHDKIFSFLLHNATPRSAP